MCEEHRNLTWTLMLLFLTGVLCNTWKVNHQQHLVCAVKGSPVVFLCSFYNADNQTVRKVLWGHTKPHLSKACLISSSFKIISTRFQFIGDTRRSCSLKIHQVEQNDAGKYFVRFNTMSTRLYEQIAPVLKVVELTISISTPSGEETIREGDSVYLTCTNRCDGGKISSVYTWFKNGEPIHEGPVLYLSNISLTNSGNYTCSLKTYAGTSSRVLHIDVQYGPRNTTVLVTPSFGADPGSRFTLICSSHANPPVENYTWFKIADGDTINVGHQQVFSPADREQYLCSVTNKHGSQNSSVVTLNIKKYWTTFPRCIIPVIATVAVVVIVTTVVAARRLNKKRMKAPVEGGEEDAKNTTYINWLSVRGSNQSQKQDQSGEETAGIVYAAVCFHNKRKPNMGQQMDTQSKDIIYSTVAPKAGESRPHPSGPENHSRSG